MLRPGPSAQALLRPVIVNGELAAPLPSASQSRDYALNELHKLPRALRSLYPTEQTWPVEYSPELLKLEEKVRARVNGAAS